MSPAVRVLGVIVALLGIVIDADAAPKVIHVFVALADNASQGIAPVPARIGDGNDPAENLYWGCDEGLKAWFSHSALWRRVSSAPSTDSVVLDRCVFRHKSFDAYVVADAYRGSEIRRAILDFLDAASGRGRATISLPAAKLEAAGRSTLVAYIGHNGLMDFRLDGPNPSDPPSRRPAIVLCCMSDAYFSPLLRQAGAQPVLTTTQLMYPGAFILHDALEAWLSEGESGALRDQAAQAYARNQKISLKSALGVFAGR
ncbi:MAG: hypothetical protein NTW86_06980 [Candidatus Sumerlaeota bacterium]|nr:hypothetical protein [Candidatus Sumerlaeota bacterium]